MKITHYRIPTQLQKEYKIALLADLHSHVPCGLLNALKEEKPHLIAIPGDLIDGGVDDAPHMLSLLKTLSGIAPTFYACGNHDLFHKKDTAAIKCTGAVYLENEVVSFDGLRIGGITSGFGFGKQGRTVKTPPPDLAFIESFSRLSGFKLLLSHHPEYYEPYLKEKDIDLILSGHAHGGQWRFFGRGVFAPGQGLFPRYTAGVHDNRLIISRGMGNHTIIPRLFNPIELVMITLTPKS